MFVCFFFFKQKTAYEMRISDWSSDVCSSDLGSRWLADYRAPFDDAMTARWRAAGLVAVGKSATSEFGLNVSTESRQHGATPNPWHGDHSAGGSSGGAAAAVAAGMVPLAPASDGGGSIRIPADRKSTRL